MQTTGNIPHDELAPVAEFLQRTLPFNTLPAEELHLATHSLIIQYHSQGSRFDRNTPAPGLCILRSGAVDIRDSSNKLLDRLGEGESFHIGGLNAQPGEITATVIEDALLYVLPDASYRTLREGNRDFDRYFGSQRNRRLRRAARYQPEPNAMMQQVGSVMARKLLTIDQRATTRSAAEAMAARRVSSALVMADEQLIGILTDRDLRVRLVAKNLPASTAVAEIMTPDPQTIESSDTLFEATLLMTQRGYHHLPVIEDGRLAGVVTTSDLILARKDDPVYLVQHISRQHDVASIKELVVGVSNLMVQWVQAGMRAEQVSRILTAISDAITVRLIQLAEQTYGTAPVAWCWVGFGSQARAEQLLGADQDNGIIIADELEEGDAQWYADVARFVCHGLNECGYPYCPGGIMATTDQWRVPLASWHDTVRKWTRTPTADAVMRASIFFDLRCIYGEATLVQQLQAVMLECASSNTIFLAALAANALDSKPPLGIFRRFVVDRDGEHRDSLDLKKRGVLPVTEIVRLRALAHGIQAVNTDDRLKALAAGRHITIVDSRNLADALHFIQQQRISHQCEQITRGEAVSNFLDPHSLSKMTREQLRDAFTIIDDAQTAVRNHYRAGMG